MRTVGYVPEKAPGAQGGGKQKVETPVKPNGGDNGGKKPEEPKDGGK